MNQSGWCFRGAAGFVLLSLWLGLQLQVNGNGERKKVGTQLALQGHTGGYGTNLVLYGVFFIEGPNGSLATVHFDALTGRRHVVEYKSIQDPGSDWVPLTTVQPCFGCIHHVVVDPVPHTNFVGRMYRVRVP